MILLIDNYDSFTYNLYQYFGTFTNDIKVVRNDKITIEEKKLMVRTRADSYPSFSQERYEYADKCGSHIITTDYPPRDVRPTDHIYDFGGYTIKLLK